MEIEYSLTPESVEWTMDWGEDYKEKYSSKANGPKERYEQKFEEEQALALFLINEVIFLNTHWWGHDDWPEEAKNTIRLLVNCNDVFMWACSDSEDIQLHELKDLYQFFKKDPAWGPAVWCICKRKEMPQPPVEARIRELGIWNFEELIEQYDIKPNWYRASSKKLHEFRQANDDRSPTDEEREAIRLSLRKELGYDA